MLTERRLVPELMDDPDVDAGELDRSLKFIRQINHRLGGTSAALTHLSRWAGHWPREQTMRILDIGTGSADIPLAIARWAEKQGLRVDITGVDVHEKTINAARRFVGDHPNVQLVQADALKLMDHFAVGEFHYAHAGLFLHHLEDIEVLTTLRIMDRLTTHGLIWNDLIRGFLAKLGVRMVTLPGMGIPAMAKHDARVSVDAGFTREEVMEFASRAGLPRPAYRRHSFHRFTLTSTKPGTPK